MGSTSGSNFFTNFFNWLLGLFKPGPGPLQMPRKVMVITYRPPGPKYAARSAPWADPEVLMSQYINKMNQLSGGQLTFEVTLRQTAPYFPLLQNGKSYTDDTWDAAEVDDSLAFRDANQQYVQIDYEKMLADFNVVQSVKDGTVDEVWLFGGPLMGFAESSMVGKNAFPCNGPRFVADCPRFVIMGFNNQRGVDEMVHDYGHRSESILAYHFGSVTLLNAMYPDPNKYGKVPLPPNSELPPPQNDFDRYLLANGTVHRAPGGIDYSQDVSVWLTKLQPDWWPPTIDPNRA